MSFYFSKVELNTLRKVSLATLLSFVISFSSVFAQNDTMYIIKSGAIVGQYNVNTEVDSVIFYKPTIEKTTTGTFTDTRDGKVYDWVQIGGQIWMAENLAYLPSVNMVTDGSEDAAGSYYYVHGYDGTNETDAKATINYTNYGVLYNWTAACNSCPAGWHLPSDAEWTALVNYLAENGHYYDGTIGGFEVKIAKSLASSSGWLISTATGAVGNSDYPAYRNKSGFTALPGGHRGSNGTFSIIGTLGHWWSATESNATSAWNRTLHNNVSIMFRYNGDVKDVGLSVRCVRD